MRWDYSDRLHATARQAATGGTSRRRPTTSMTQPGSACARSPTRSTVEDPGARTQKSERIYLGTFEVYREYGPDGAVTLERETLHVIDDKQRVALVETRTEGTDRGPAELMRYQLANHLGSSVLELDECAQVITYEEYYPYGSTSYQAVRVGTETPEALPLHRQGARHETGLYYHGRSLLRPVARPLDQLRSGRPRRRPEPLRLRARQPHQPQRSHGSP